MATANEKVSFLIELRDKTGAALQKIGAKFQKMNAETKQAQTRFKRLDGRVQGATKSLQAASIQIAAFAATAYGAFRAFESSENFQKQMHLVNTIAGKTNEEFRAMSESVREVAGDYGLMANDASAALYDIYSNVGDTGRNMEILEDAAQASVAGMVDLNTTAAAATGVINAMGMTVSELDEIFDAQFKTIERGKLKYRELAASSGMFLSSAKSAGQEYARIMGGFATLTKDIQNASIAATSMNAFLRRFTDPEFVKNMRALGVAVVDNEGKFRDYTEVIAELNEKLEGVDEFRKQKIMKKLVVGEEASRALKILLNNFDTFYQDVVAVSEEAAGTTKKNFDEMFDASKLDIMRSKWGDFKIELGEEIAPAMIGFIESMDRGLDALSGVLVMISGTMKSIHGIALSIEAGWHRVKALFGGGKKAMDEASKTWQAAAKSFFEANEKLNKGGVKVLTGLFVGEEERAGEDFNKDMKKHQERLKAERAGNEGKSRAGGGEGGGSDTGGAEGGGDTGVTGRTPAGRPGDLIRAWSTWSGDLVGSLQTAAAEHQARIDQARETLIRSRRGDNAADAYRARSDYKTKVQEIKRRGASPMEFDAAEAERDARLQEIAERAAAERAEAERAREDVLMLAADRWQKERTMLDREYEEKMKMYRNDAEARASINEWYSLEKQNIETRRREWEKSQADYYTRFHTGQLREMLANERTAQNEKLRIRQEINERIRSGEIGQMEAFRIGLAETVEGFRSASEIMADNAREAAISMKEGFENVFFNAMKGNFDSLGDFWDSTMQSMKNSYLKAFSEMLAQKMTEKLGAGLGGGGAMSENKGGGGVVGAILGGVGSILSFAEGAVVKRPTLAVVGDAAGEGAEAVIPLKRGAVPVEINNGSGQGGGNITNHVYHYHVGTIVEKVEATDANSFRKMLAGERYLIGEIGRARVMKDLRGNGPVKNTMRRD